ncbi:hypothetical protein ACFWBN_03130 [Streptomyces sp. NPDC059989]|uniref:hypothetical protein n=1 Tax=Streptomyces sp. NPDC059989 TaxID=3347026 RepID=UPI0036CD5E00
MGRGTKKQRPAVAVPQSVWVMPTDDGRAPVAVEIDREPSADGSRAGHVREGAAR